jgi:hypothetical protein
MVLTSAAVPVLPVMYQWCCQCYFSGAVTAVSSGAATLVSVVVLLVLIQLSR